MNSKLEWIRLYIIIDKPSHPNFYPIQIFPAKTIDVKYIISNINLFFAYNWSQVSSVVEHWAQN